jgi:hypothetical protein
MRACGCAILRLEFDPMPATLFFPTRDLRGQSTAAMQANLLADLREGFESVTCSEVVSEFTDLDSGQTYRARVCAYVCAPTDTPRQARRVDLVAGRWAGIAGLPMVEVEGADGVRYDVSPSEPCAFVSRKVRDELESDAA